MAYSSRGMETLSALHDDVIKWKHFTRYWPFVRGILRSPVNSPHKGQWRGALMFTLICARINGWVNNGEAGDLRRNRAHYDVIIMKLPFVKRRHRPSVVSSHRGLVMRYLDISIVSINKLLNKQYGYRWFESPQRSCDVTVIWIHTSMRFSPISAN